MLTLNHTESLTIVTKSPIDIDYSFDVTVRPTSYNVTQQVTVDEKALPIIDHLSFDGNINGESTTTVIAATGVLEKLLFVDSFRITNKGTTQSIVEVRRGTVTIHRVLLKPGYSSICGKKGKISLVDKMGFKLTHTPWTNGINFALKYTIPTPSVVQSSTNYSIGSGVVFVGFYDSNKTAIKCYFNITTWTAPTIGSFYLVAYKVTNFKPSGLTGNLSSTSTHLVPIASLDISASLTGTGVYTFTLPIANASPGDMIWIGVYPFVTAGSFVSTGSSMLTDSSILHNLAWSPFNNTGGTTNPAILVNVPAVSLGGSSSSDARQRCIAFLI